MSEKTIDKLLELGFHEVATRYEYDFIDYIITLDYFSDRFDGDVLKVKKSGEADIIFTFQSGNFRDFKKLFNIFKKMHDARYTTVSC